MANSVLKEYQRHVIRNWLKERPPTNPTPVEKKTGNGPGAARLAPMQTPAYHFIVVRTEGRRLS